MTHVRCSTCSESFPRPELFPGTPDAQWTCNSCSLTVSCLRCFKTFSPSKEPSRFCALCNFSWNHQVQTGALQLKSREADKERLSSELSKVETELKTVKTELQRVQRTSTFLQAWDEDMFVAPLADVWLRTTDETSAAIGAHRCVLASKSPVFKAMLFNDMKEKETGLVEIADISYDVLQALIIFLYKGDVKQDFLAVKVQPLLEAAIKYDIEGLRQICITYILDNSIPTAPYKDGELDKVMCLLQLALKYNLTEVNGAVVKKLTRNGPAIGNRELQMLLVCDRFLSLKETDPLGALEICQCVMGDAIAQPKEQSS